MTQRRHVVFGAGGVGKTTCSAALAVALARGGLRTLVVTTDPARRLASALDVVDSTSIVAVPWQPGLDCFMPEARATTRTIAAELFASAPGTATSLIGNPVFEVMCSGLAGIHELATLASLGARATGYDALVIDTAPSEHALELVGLPGRMAALLESRALTWLGRLSEHRSDAPRGLASRLVDWGQRRFIARFDDVLGDHAVNATLDVVRALAAVRPALARMLAAAGELLTGSSTEHVIVLVPRAGSAPLAYRFAAELATLGERPAAYIINRCADAPPTWMDRLALATDLPPALSLAVQLALASARDATASASATEAALRQLGPALRVLCVAEVEAPTPMAIVDEVAGQLASIVQAAR